MNPSSSNPTTQSPNTKLTAASLIDLGRSTATAFGEDRVGRHAAALAYYTVFSISPLLVVLISIAALYFQDEARSIGAIQSQIQDTVGPTAGKAIEQMIQSSTAHGGDSSKPILATVVAVLVALWGASGLFGALQDSLNAIWAVAPKPGLGFLATVRNRFISFAMVLTIGFLLLVSLVASTALSAIVHKMPGGVGDSFIMAQILNVTLGIAISTLLFAAIFKVLPDAKIEWRDVWVGAFVTGLLFTLGRVFLSWFLARPNTASAYGSASALVVLLLWVNYASTILFVGAEFTKAFANKFGSRIEPDDNAVSLAPHDQVKQGQMPTKTPGAAQPSPKEVLAAKSSAALKNGSPGNSAKAGNHAQQRQEFEFMLSVVSGAALVFMWAVRKQAKARAKAEKALG